MGNQIKNWDILATTENRKLALSLAKAGLEAINTENVILSSIKLENDILSVMGETFDLSKYKNVKVVGFGKASGDGALALEKILGERITAGAVVGLEKVDTKHIETFVGTHPKPSPANVSAGQKIYEIIKDSSEDDLIIVLVSGGGSALLCPTESEREQEVKLFDVSIKCGDTIIEMNTIRKHLSALKGGGLAKTAYPATVIGLIFSDVPGDNFNEVASGATYRDESTILDAEKIIDKYNLGHFDLTETPKEDKYFEKVHNFVLVSNKTAIEAMAKKGEGLGLKTKVISMELYDEVSEALSKIFSAKENDAIVLAAGEPKIEVKGKGGKGGRNLHMGLKAMQMGLIDEDSVFISLASDGMDNSDSAGAIVDKNAVEKASKLNLNIEDYLNHFDSYDFFQKSGDIIMTGPTGANVSDLMILLTKK